MIVTLITYPHALASSLTLPMEMLQAAADIARTQKDRHPLEWQIVTADDQAAISASGLVLQPTHPLAQAAAADLVVLPTLWRNPLPLLRRYASLLPWLVEHARRGGQIAAVGSASYWLAEAGLLNRHPATTHWHFFDRFAQRYPQVILKRHHLITQAGHLYCAGSLNALTDLMVHLIDQHFGSRTARRVERQFSPESRRPFRSHAFVADSVSGHEDELMTQVQQRLREQLSHQEANAVLAARFGISERTLLRRFQEATGMTPGQYRRELRLQLARELLHQSNLTISEIAERCGYPDSSHFTRVFRQVQQQTPRAYRLSVRGKLFQTIQ